MTEKELEHRHGGIHPADFSRLNLPQRAFIDFSINLNPLGPPPIIREWWMELLGEIENYPTPAGDGVSHYYEERYGISPDTFVAGNGSTELIYLAPRVLGLKQVIIVMPTYYDYLRASLLAGAKVIPYHLSQGSGFFSLRRDEIMESLKDGDGLWLGNPNNPTGSLFPKDLILEISRKYPEKWIIIDEAFMPFVEEREDFSLLTPHGRKNILVIHSLTKFYALAGIRIGGVIAHREVIARFRRFKEPWTVNGVAEKIAPLLLGCGGYEEESVSLITAERERLVKALGKTRGVAPCVSAANFVLCQWHLTDNLDHLLNHLISEGIYVRDCRNFRGLEKNWFRVAVRSPEEDDRLVAAIGSFPGGSDD
jgi:threonine-phosphate decarboxylase